MSTRRWFYSVNRPSQIEVVSVYVGDVGNVKTTSFISFYESVVLFYCSIRFNFRGLISYLGY